MRNLKATNEWNASISVKKTSNKKKNIKCNKPRTILMLDPTKNRSTLVNTSKIVKALSIKAKEKVIRHI